MSGGRTPRLKGAQFERDVVAVLRANGHEHAERAYGAGRPYDVGDIDGVVGFAIECKCQPGRLALAEWIDEAALEASVAGTSVLPVVVAKRRGEHARRAYVVMELADWAQAIRRADAP